LYINRYSIYTNIMGQDTPIVYKQISTHKLFVLVEPYRALSLKRKNVNILNKYMDTFSLNYNSVWRWHK